MTEKDISKLMTDWDESITKQEKDIDKEKSIKEQLNKHITDLQSELKAVHEKSKQLEEELKQAKDKIILLENKLQQATSAVALYLDEIRKQLEYPQVNLDVLLLSPLNAKQSNDDISKKQKIISQEVTTQPPLLDNNSAKTTQTFPQEGLAPAHSEPKQSQENANVSSEQTINVVKSIEDNNGNLQNIRNLWSKVSSLISTLKENPNEDKRIIVFQVLSFMFVYIFFEFSSNAAASIWAPGSEVEWLIAFLIFILTLSLLTLLGYGVLHEKFHVKNERNGK